MNQTTESDPFDQEELLTICTELKRCVSRVSYVGMGHSNELDRALEELRANIKNEEPIDSVKKSVDSISDILRTIDDDGQDIEAANDKIDLLNLLLKTPLPKSLRRDLKSVKKQSGKKDASAIVHSIVDIIQNYITELESSVGEATQSKENKTGFLSTLFRKNKKKKVKAGNKDKSKSEKTSNDFSFPEKLKDALKLLIDQLSSMDGYSGIASSLNEEISKIVRIEQLSTVLEMITNAFVEVSDQEHIQFEKFLKTLNSRIIRVNEFINQTLKYSKSNDHNSKQLSLELTNNISGMKSSLTDSKTLEDAKVTVFNHMDSIVNQLNQYCIKQESNSEVLVSQMDKLTEQLRATEDEATRLKNDLAEQRVRAQTDPLTKLPNRYSYNERLTQEYNRWRRYRHSLTLVIGDIDLFKRVNDDYGHAFGDTVLKQIAGYLGESVRESDFIARFGGEEFVILLPETGIVDATRAINKIRSEIAKIEFHNNQQLVPVTMSFGVSEFENDDTPNTVFERADKALYRAKAKGRNRVCCQRPKAS